MRTRRSVGLGSAQIEHHAAFVLLHVDGVSDVAAIATVLGQPISEVLACFSDLTRAGLVEMTVAYPAPAESGVFPCLRANA